MKYGRLTYEALSAHALEGWKATRKRFGMDDECQFAKPTTTHGSKKKNHNVNLKLISTES